jgi:hypothetical protein
MKALKSSTDAILNESDKNRQSNM